MTLRTLVSMKVVSALFLLFASLGINSLAVAAGKVGGNPSIEARALLADPGASGDPVGAVPCREGS